MDCPRVAGAPTLTVQAALHNYAVYASHKSSRLHATEPNVKGLRPLSERLLTAPTTLHYPHRPPTHS